MAVDNKQIATDVLELVGGAENVAVATNCMTRLRLTLKDNSKADVEKIKKVKGVLGCQFAGSQLQVIIGQNVPKVYDEVCAMGGFAKSAAIDENLDAPKQKLTRVYCIEVIFCEIYYIIEWYFYKVKLNMRCKL